MGELSRVVLWIGIQFYPGETCPSLGERVGYRRGGEDGVDPFEGNGCAQRFDHLLHPWKNIIRLELIEGEWRADEYGVSTLRARSDGEDKI